MKCLHDDATQRDAHFDVIDNTLHQIECDICGFGGRNICGDFA